MERGVSCLSYKTISSMMDTVWLAIWQKLWIFCSVNSWSLASSTSQNWKTNNNKEPLLVLWLN
jgi:hypothetical protein